VHSLKLKNLGNIKEETIWGKEVEANILKITLETNNIEVNKGFKTAKIDQIFKMRGIQVELGQEIKEDRREFKEAKDFLICIAKETMSQNKEDNKEETFGNNINKGPIDAIMHINTTSNTIHNSINSTKNITTHNIINRVKIKPLISKALTKRIFSKTIV
jgi:galactitol-specific phosphotransferase system IIB component